MVSRKVRHCFTRLVGRKRLHGRFGTLSSLVTAQEDEKEDLLPKKVYWHSRAWVDIQSMTAAPLLDP